MPERPDGGLLLWKYWLPGFVLAGLGGLLAFALAARWASFGWGLVLGVPLAIGCAMGYGMRVRRAATVMSAFVLIPALLLGGLTLRLAGLLCALVLAAVILGPVFLGMFLGFLMRARLKSSAFSQGRYLPALFFLPPVGLLYAEGRIDVPSPVEAVQTSRVFAMSEMEVWERLTFYEEIALEPPALARLGLPHPLFTRGAIDGVGDIKVCVYDTGHLVKAITVFEPGRLLEFDVIEQRGIEDRSIELIDGGFALDALPDGTTRVTLTTRYRPLLSARAFWRPFEHRLTGALHHHVLDAIGLAAGRPVFLDR